MSEENQLEEQTDEITEEVEAAEVVEEQAEEEISMEGTELDQFESGEIEEEEFIPTEQVQSILESMLFASDRPLSVAAMKQAFKGSNVNTRQIKKALEALAVEYASVERGVTLEDVSGGYQLRTKVDNMDFLKRMVKARSFRLSGPAMEVLSIVAYKQPLVKAEIDEIRGVESGHLLRALMEKGICCFAGKSELPGKPMLYATTRKFLEIFGLKNLKELPTLNEIDELLPEGIGEEEEEEQQLSDITGELSEQIGDSYSEGEEELLKISNQLSDINTSSDFFEEEKRRQREKRDADRARDIQEALEVGEAVEEKDQRWLKRYLDKKAEEEAAVEEPVSEKAVVEDLEPVVDPEDKMAVIEAAKAIEEFEKVESEEPPADKPMDLEI